MKLREHLHQIGVNWPPRHWWVWNWLPADVRYLGVGCDWYDGPIYHCGFWFFNVGFSW